MCAYQSVLKGNCELLILYTHQAHMVTRSLPNSFPLSLCLKGIPLVPLIALVLALVPLSKSSKRLYDFPIGKTFIKIPLYTNNLFIFLSYKTVYFTYMYMYMCVFTKNMWTLDNYNTESVNQEPNDHSTQKMKNFELFLKLLGYTKWEYWPFTITKGVQYI